MPRAFDAVVTVDGASGTGKSTLLRALHRRYGAMPIEFGPMVRTIAWLVEHNRTTVLDAVALMSRMERSGKLLIAEPTSQQLAASEVVVEGVPMRQRIFSSHLADATGVTSEEEDAVAWAADLVRMRIFGKRAVLSGRQAFTLICPGAALRIRLEASPQVRASRKLRQFAQSGLKPYWADDVRLLEPPENVHLTIDTTSLSVEQVEQAAFRAVESRLGWKPEPCGDGDASSPLPPAEKNLSGDELVLPILP